MSENQSVSDVIRRYRNGTLGSKGLMGSVKRNWITDYFEKNIPFSVSFLLYIP